MVAGVGSIRRIGRERLKDDRLDWAGRRNGNVFPHVDAQVVRALVFERLVGLITRVGAKCGFCRLPLASERQACVFEQVLVFAFDDGHLSLHLEIESFLLDHSAAHDVPGGTDRAIDERAFDVVTRSETGGEIAAERVVLVEIFVRDDEARGPKAMPVCVLGRAGSAFRRLRARGLLCIRAIGRDAAFRCCRFHVFPS
jgi:hypothetical protein